jgi:hypothetical protein
MYLQHEVRANARACGSDGSSSFISQSHVLWPTPKISCSHLPP